jgi:hypothetical protein
MLVEELDHSRDDRCGVRIDGDRTRLEVVIGVQHQLVFISNDEAERSVNRL